MSHIEFLTGNIEQEQAVMENIDLLTDPSDFLEESFLEEATFTDDGNLLSEDYLYETGGVCDQYDVDDFYLAEKTAVELADVNPREAGVEFNTDFEKYQFYNQNQIVGISTKDLETTYHPDNNLGDTTDYNTPTTKLSRTHRTNLTEYLLSEPDGISYYGEGIEDQTYDQHSDMSDDEEDIDFDNSPDVSTEDDDDDSFE